MPTHLEKGPVVLIIGWEAVNNKIGPEPAQASASIQKHNFLYASREWVPRAAPNLALHDRIAQYFKATQSSMPREVSQSPTLPPSSIHSSNISSSHQTPSHTLCASLPQQFHGATPSGRHEAVARRAGCCDNARVDVLHAGSIDQ